MDAVSYAHADDAHGRITKYYHTGESEPVNPEVGMEWAVPSSGKIYKYINDGTSDVWVDVASAGGSAAIQKSVEYVAGTPKDNYTGDLSTYETNGYTPGYLEVVVEGMVLGHSEYTATDGQNVVLNVARTAGNLVRILVFGTFAFADHYTKTETDLLVGDASVITSSSSTVANQDSLSIDNFVVSKNFSAITYTGNGTTQDIVTGIDSNDLTDKTQVTTAGGIAYLDRVTNQMKATVNHLTELEDAVLTSGSDVINTSKVHVKSRSLAVSNVVYDGIRGAMYDVRTDLTQTEVNSTTGVTAFTGAGFSIGSTSLVNTNLATYVAYQTLYTHIKWGTTSQGKFQLEAYNPVTKEGMVYYIGSGNAGHQISHSQGVKLDYYEVKGLNIVDAWEVGNSSNDVSESMILNDINENRISNYYDGRTSTYISVAEFPRINTADSEYIMYYKCKSETFDILQRQTSSTTDTPIYGSDGEYLFTADTIFGDETLLFIIEKYENKIVRIIHKYISTTGAWRTFDYNRGLTNYIELDSSAIEVTVTYLLNPLASTTDSFFNQITDGSSMNMASTTFTYSDGYGENGIVRRAEQITGTIDFTGVTDGWKWVAKEEGASTYSFYDKKPSYGLYEKESADDNRLVLKDGKFYGTTGGELVSNGTFDTDITGWTNPSSVGSFDSGRLKIDSDGTNYYNYQIISNMVIGEAYKLKIDIGIGGTETAANCLIGTAIAVADMGIVSSSSASETLYIEFIATSASVYITCANAHTAIGNIGYFDNISVYKKEATLSTPLVTPISFSRLPVMVANETPQIFGDDELALEYVESLSVDNLEASELILHKTTFANDGIDYVDPDAIGANPIAKIYPDGTIVGSTDNGSYTKYPDGDIIYSGTTSISGADGMITATLPISSLIDVYVGGSLSAGSHSSMINYYQSTNNKTTIYGVARSIADGVLAVGRAGRYIAKGRWK